MGKLVYSSDRKFLLSDFHVSHRQLLLRSPIISEKKEGELFNIDINFWEVFYVQMPTHFYGIEIYLVDNFKEGLGVNSEFRNKKGFKIKTSGCEYIIVSSFFQVFENKFEYETSLGLEPFTRRGKKILTIKNF